MTKVPSAPVSTGRGDVLPIHVTPHLIRDESVPLWNESAVKQLFPGPNERRGSPVGIEREAGPGWGGQSCSLGESRAQASSDTCINLCWFKQWVLLPPQDLGKNVAVMIPSSVNTLGVQDPESRGDRL